MQTKSELYEAFGQKLKAIRKEQKMTQVKFSKYLSIERTLYTKYETGSAMPPYQKLCEISKLLDVSVDFLLGLKDDKDC